MGNKDDDYYYTGADKISDVLWGILLTFVFLIFSFFIVAVFNILAKVWWIFPIIFLLGIAFSFYKRRQYLAIGMIATVVVPLLIVGGCLALTGGSFG